MAADPIMAAKERLEIDVARILTCQPAITGMEPGLPEPDRWVRDLGGDLASLLAHVARLEGENERLAKAWEVKHKSQTASEKEAKKWFEQGHAAVKRAISSEAALAEARRQIAESREAFLNFVADAKKFEQDIDGEYEDGRSVVTIRYDITTEHYGLWELIGALGFTHRRDETPFDAVCREIDEAPAADLLSKGSEEPAAPSDGKSAYYKALFSELSDAIQICRNNSTFGSADERQAWEGMATRLRDAVRGPSA